MSDDYCLTPNQRGIGNDCSPCYQRRIEQLQSKLAAASKENAFLKSKITAALICHPKAVDTLLTEAIKLDRLDEFEYKQGKK